MRSYSRKVFFYVCRVFYKLFRHSLIVVSPGGGGHVATIVLWQEVPTNYNCVVLVFGILHKSTYLQASGAQQEFCHLKDYDAYSCQRDDARESLNFQKYDSTFDQAVLHNKSSIFQSLRLTRYSVSLSSRAVGPAARWASRRDDRSFRRRSRSACFRIWGSRKGMRHPRLLAPNNTEISPREEPISESFRRRRKPALLMTSSEHTVGQ